MFRLAGIDQWITVKGEDRRSPVVLFELVKKVANDA
jgi:hypothetical protein